MKKVRRKIAVVGVVAALLGIAIFTWMIEDEVPEFGDVKKVHQRSGGCGG